MEATVTDLSTKTQRRLRKAYCRLLLGKNRDKINVSILTEEADVSRATFYLYYQNIDEFVEDMEKYILSLFVKQIRIFLDSGKAEVKQACKKKNMIFTDDDFKLFSALYSDIGFGFDEQKFKILFNIFNENIPEYFDKKFVKKNKERFDLFYIGYACVMRDNFFDYNSDKVYRDVLRSMVVWDFLFPDHKFED